MEEDIQFLFTAWNKWTNCFL